MRGATPRGHTIRAWTLAAVLFAAVPGADLPGQDWPGFRGPAQDGTAPAPELAGGRHRLELAWKRPLGSGYASISVAGDVGVTLFSDGDRDFVAAFRVADGEELWRHAFGPAHRGRDGSNDGPLSTPALAGETAYALGPRGRLVALDLASGRLSWQVDLPATTGSTRPQYGFATSPLVHGELLIVQTGGPDGRAITAFERADGKVRWTAGDDGVSYQSPAILEIAGRRRLVAAGDHFLTLLEPATGEVHLRHHHTPDGAARGASGHPLRLSDDRLLFRPGSDEVMLVELRTAGDGDLDGRLDLTELWRSDQLLKRSHAAVLSSGEGLFSFDAQFLTCLDPVTGERLWKSRPPGGRALIGIGPYLAILSLRGEVVLARPELEGYRETARLAVFDRGDWAPPSYAHGSLFVRNLSEMARVRLVAAPPDEPGPADLDATAAFTPAGKIATLVERLAASDDPDATVDAFLARQSSFPIVEDGGLVHFVYRGDARDVALSGNLTEHFGDEVPMARLPGTDLFVTSYRLELDGHYEYRFHVDFGPGLSDPRNALAIGSIFGQSSELRMPGWKVPPHLGEAGTPRGHVEELELADDHLRVYLPPGYEAGKSYPVLWIQGGQGVESARIDRTLDHWIGRGVTPVIAVELPVLEHEHDLRALEAYARRLTTELLPELAARYRLLPGAGDRALLGSGSGAPIATFVAFRHPEIFGRLALQSFFLDGYFGKLGAGTFSLTPELGDALRTLVASSENPPPAVYVEWSRHESADVSSGLDARADTRELLRALRRRGLEPHIREVSGSPGWGSWRAGHGHILKLFFPAEADDPR